MWTQSKGRGHPPAKRWAGKVECRSGENLESGIRDNGLWCRALRQLRRDREVRQILESEREVTARREPGSTFLRRGEQSGSQAGKVTARQEPRPTGRAKLPLSPIQSSVTVSLGQTSWADKVAGPAAGIFHCQIKCLTVIHLIRGCAVTTCNFHDALLERWTGGIYRPAIEANQRLNRRQQRQRRTYPKIRFWVAATGRCRRAIRRAERDTKWRLCMTSSSNKLSKRSRLSWPRRLSARAARPAGR